MSTAIPQPVTPCRDVTRPLWDDRIDGETPDVRASRHFAAQRLCRGCHLIEACARARRPVDTGVWAGVLWVGSADGSTPARRQRIALRPVAKPTPPPAPVKAKPVVEKRPPRPRAVLCGTPSGRTRHARRGERPCDACRAAQAEYARDRRATTRPACGSRSGYFAHLGAGETPCQPCVKAKREQKAAAA